MPGPDGFSDHPQRKIVAIAGVDGCSKVADSQQDDRPTQPAAVDKGIGTLSAKCVLSRIGRVPARLQTFPMSAKSQVQLLLTADANVAS
ncbi:hypothetical protein [Brevundimonas sp. PAMC22021]|uniref:hypothetical protein n=1 Tax=Brevundimonas sp. PAMC22021 TaxID=2861285 RepID=UPI001C634852|nr:hypothetical protein [Brevundimonas sp. PAMC22021]QYF86954.1 hypothetical protein KY493_00010 [Brevundimonas sp. PAMC22021]